MMSAEIIEGGRSVLRAEWDSLEGTPRFSGDAGLQAQALALDSGYSPTPVPAGFVGMRALVLQAKQIGLARSLRTTGIRIREAPQPAGTEF